MCSLSIGPVESQDGSVRWGTAGHEMAATAALSSLPTNMPPFFLQAEAQLVYLNPEPDRWRRSDRSEMDRAWDYGHYIDLENVPDGALEAPDRFTYLRMLYEAGLARPERDGGFLPFRILELYQRIVTEWELWRGEGDPDRKRWIENRIVNDAGILGHYVTDASQPHHTTIHFNGWAQGAPNPEGYSEARGIHGRFEGDFVRAHVSQTEVSTRVAREPRSVAGTAKQAVTDQIRRSHAAVETLYRLDRDIGFDPDRPAARATLDFAADRLADGASMLASLWWSAWLESASP